MTYGEINVRFFSIYRGEHFGGIELSNVKMKQGDVARNRFRMFHRLTAADATQAVRLQLIAG
jgi:hypothetical protein